MADLLSRLKTGLADRYSVECELGAGGMATVYLATDLKHDRQAAIKVLRPELTAVLGAERFVLNSTNPTRRWDSYLHTRFTLPSAPGVTYRELGLGKGDAMPASRSGFARRS
jgi:serine/threonine-protein kinase